MVIGTLRETSLHAALKQWYARPGDSFEVAADGYLVDIGRGEHLIEIQLHNFSAIRAKLRRLLEQRPVRLVHPIAQEKTIVRLGRDGQTTASRRKSPKRGRVEHLFVQLVSIPELVRHPNFSLEVVLTREEEILREGRGGSWRRRGWRIDDRRLLEVVEHYLFASPTDFSMFLPPALPAVFTNRDLAGALGQPLLLAQKMTYCLRRMGLLDLAGQQGRALLYTRSQ